MAKLSDILSHLVRCAEEHPEQKQSTHLKNGLTIDIKVDQAREGCTHLQMHRPGVFPSPEEWATVSRHWPYPVQIEPKQTRYKERFYLHASWPTPKRLFPAGDVCAQTQEDDARGDQ